MVTALFAPKYPVNLVQSTPLLFLRPGRSQVDSLGLTCKTTVFDLADVTI